MFTRSVLSGISTVLLLGSFLSSLNAAEQNEIPPAAKAILEKAEYWDVYSLSPIRREADDPRPINPADEFHGWEVLGKARIKTPMLRESLLTAFEQGVKENKGVAALCFMPRHGIRVVHSKRVADFVICFECMQVEVYLNGEEVAGFLITDSPQKTFDTVLEEARIPLAPQPGAID